MLAQGLENSPYELPSLSCWMVKAALGHHNSYAQRTHGDGCIQTCTKVFQYSNNRCVLDE